jgi:probable H4MPT-linked C1 transfer pathway protein
MTGTVLGLDVGGANLKAAHSGSICCSRPFALWRNPTGLPQALAGLLRESPGLPTADELAVTMTGELCDCFASKREGVHAILDAVETVADGMPVWVWRTDGRLVDLAVARAESPLLTAAANWLALATWAGRLAPSGPALLIDIGTTTTDIIPLQDGIPTPRGRTDPERLASRELVYTGIRRTPVCALGGDTPLAAEWFATTHDVYLVLGMVAEDAQDRDTADGRLATRSHAHARLARMLGADLDTSSETQRFTLAEEIHQRQMELLGRAVQSVAGRLTGPPRTIILSGAGELLARKVLTHLGLTESTQCRVVSIQETLGASLSQAACAYAVAILRKEQGQGE